MSESGTEPTVLLIDDDESIRTVLRMRLKAGGYRPLVCTTGAEALLEMAAHQVDVVLSDLRLENEDGLEVMERIHTVDASMPVLLLTAHGSIPNAVEAIKRGAAGYLTKPVDRGELFAQLDRCVANRRMKDEITTLRRAVEDRGELQGIIGQSAAMRRVFELISRFAPTPLTVAIHGESGTGKELVARALHDLSPRANRTFMAINCAAIADQLLQSELFGHKRGAFTGANSDREGLFQRADGGTLFLDEIGDMSPALQVSLLRVLQEREVMPVGGRTPVKVNVRVIVATHRDLRKLVEQAGFREDLFYRVNVAPIHLPPLRDRGDDVVTLANHFLNLCRERYGRSELTFSGASVEAMRAHAWPGNVRELEHAIQRAVVMTDGKRIEAKDVLSGAVTQQPLKADSEEPLRPMREARAEWECNYLKQLLKSTSGNVSAAARTSGKYRADLYALLKKHSIDPAEFKP